MSVPGIRQQTDPKARASTPAMLVLDGAIDRFLRVGGDIDEMIEALAYRAETLKLARADIKTHYGTANDRG